MKLLRITLIALAAAILFLANPLVSFATTLAQQTGDFSTPLNVWEALQELGNNLSSKAGTFTFRVSTSKTNLNQFDYTAQNSRIYDKDNNNSYIVGCIPSGANPADPLRGLIFNTSGVLSGYEDVSIDFSCRNYSFIPGHRYLIWISNANMAAFGGSRIQFGTGAYGPGGSQTTDLFTGGGLRYAFDNASCYPQNYVWNSPTANSGCNVFTSPKDDLYFTLTDSPPGPNPTPAPTPSPTPTPTPAPSPFLDLPWDYESKGLSFNEAAHAITSYFDHEYPLLSSGLSEPSQASGSVIKFDDPTRSGESYSSHDGYDYAKLAKVNIGDPVLAAAAGTATYINSCGACGNMIVIDHGNGYQTRYLHLQKDGLITSTPGQKITVTARQPIGKVGATGNVSPTGDAGAHIHFGVFQDKNKNGNFDDNIPDGVTDPFGWQSKDPDPWATYTFFYNGQNRTGNKSYYLWTKKLDNLDASLTANGGVFKTSRATLNFPAGATNQNLSVNVQSAPVVKANNSLSSIGSTIIATAKDILGNIVTQFQSLFTMTINFSGFDLTRYRTDTISIYSSQDGINWDKVPTTVDMSNQTATTQINHFTHFALMAERKDTIAPTTMANLSGQQGQGNWFRSDTRVSLQAKDNDGGLGVDYTLYKLDGADWETYTAPLTLSTEGHHKIEFYSVDKDENIENPKSQEFDIDKIPPEVSISANPKTIWPPNNKMVDVTVSGNSLDAHLTSTHLSIEDEYHQVEPAIVSFGQIVQLEAKRDGGDLDGRVYIIKAVAEDLAGNQTEKQVQVVVPHDQRKNK